MIEKACLITGKPGFEYKLIYKFDEKILYFLKNLIEMCDIKVFFFTAQDDFCWYCYDTLTKLKEEYPDVKTYYLDIACSDCCDNSLINTWEIDDKYIYGCSLHDPTYIHGKTFPKCPEIQLDYMSKKILDEILFRNTSIICYGDIYDKKTTESFHKFVSKYHIDSFTVRKYNLTCFKAYEPSPSF